MMYTDSGLGTKREAKISWDKVIDIHLFHQIIKNTIVQKMGEPTI